MAEALGVDIVDVARIGRAYSTYGDRFLRRILGPDEMIAFSARHNKIQFLAGRFAAKEAVVKALGQYLSKRPPLSTLQVLNDHTGQPRLHLPGHIKGKLPNVRCLVSISHNRSSAIATAIFTEE